MKSQLYDEKILVLTKTYPQPSKKYRETTCVAAVTHSGALTRLFPVPYRFLDGEHQFKKWEWINTQLLKASNDHRPESYRINVDSIERTGFTIGTQHAWKERRKWIEPHIVESFTALEERRKETLQTLGIIQPAKLLQLEIKPEKDTEWSEKEKDTLQREGLFDSIESRSRPPLRKLPYNFYYHYECETSNGVVQHRHMITDWEVGALYWNCYRSHGTRWEHPFRQKLEEEFSQKDLFFLMGTVHRFPDQWLIIGLIYPPKMPVEQLSMGI